MQFCRIYTGADGKSHFEDFDQNQGAKHFLTGLDVETGQKMLRSLILVEIFEMRLAVRAGVDSAKLHATSKAKF